MVFRRALSGYLGYLRVGLNIVRRRWLAVAVTFLVPNLVVVGYLLTAPPKYRATGKIILEPSPGRESLGFIKQPFVTPTDLANQIERIKSDEVMNGAAALAEGLSEEEMPGSPPPADEISTSLTVSELKGTDIIYVSIDANDGRRAAAIANLVIDSYIELHVSDMRTEAGSVREFIDAQVVEYERRLRESETALKVFKERAGTVELAVETENVTKNLAEFDRIAEENAMDLAGKLSRLKYFEDRLRAFRDDLKHDRTYPATPLAEELQDKLVALEYRYASLSLKGYPPDHEEMVAMAAEIELARERLAAEMEGIIEGEASANPYEEITGIAAEMADVRATIAELDARRATLDDVRGSAEDELKTLPELEMELAKLTRERQANEGIYIMLLEKREEARIAEAEVVGDARVFGRALPPASPVSPNKKQSVFLGVLLGFLFSVSAALFLEYTDKTIRTPGELKSVVSAPVVGVIPLEPKRSAFRPRGVAGEFPNGANGDYPVMLRNPRSAVADAYRGLRVRFLHSVKNVGEVPNVIAVTSVSPEEGKTTVAANLAVALAAAELNVCLVDSDFNRPSIGKVFGLKPAAGFVDILIGEMDLEDVIIPDVVPYLSVVPGRVKTDVTGYPGNGSLYRTIEILRRGGFDFVIFDTGPLLSVADTLDVAGLLDGYLLVLRAGRVVPSDVIYCEELINQVGGVVVGAVLNCVTPEDIFGGKGYSYYSEYFYRYGGSPGSDWRSLLPNVARDRNEALPPAGRTE